MVIKYGLATPTFTYSTVGLYLKVLLRNLGPRKPDFTWSHSLFTACSEIDIIKYFLIDNTPSVETPSTFFQVFEQSPYLSNTLPHCVTNIELGTHKIVTDAVALVKSEIFVSLLTTVLSERTFAFVYIFTQKRSCSINIHFKRCGCNEKFNMLFYS